MRWRSRGVTSSALLCFVAGTAVHDEQEDQDEAREREEVSSGRDRQ